MRRSPGEKIGEGGTSDIHAWAPGQVLKLFKAGPAQGLGRHEARMTRAVFAAGGPALEVLGEVWLEGRFGIVLPRLHGPTLLDLWQTRAMTAEQAGAVLAALYISVHRTPAPQEVFCLPEWFAALSRGSGSQMPEFVVTGVLTRIERLAAPNLLCHGDLHPGNVIITAEGPRIIDWSAAVRAPAIFDLWRCDITLKELAYAPEKPGPAGALNAAAWSGYERLAGLAAGALTAQFGPYLPILRGVALAEGALGAVVPREELIRRLEADLGSAPG